MANTPETRTTMDNLLKYNYAPAIYQLTKEQSQLLSLFETRVGKMGAGGKSFVQPLELNNMGSVGARGESGTLPDALPGTWLNTSVPIYYNYFSISVSGPAMATSNSDKYAFAEAWQREIVVKQRAFRQHINRQLCADGTGIIAQVDGSPSGATVTLDNAYGLSGYNNSDVNGARFVTANMKLDFYTGSTLRDSGSVLVSAYTKGAFPSTSATITASTSASVASVADGDYVYVAGAKGYEMPGIRLLIDDGTVAASFQGVSASTYAEWRSAVGYGSTPGTAEAITTARIQSVVDDIETYNGGMVDWMFTSPGVWLTYGEMARSENLITNARKMDTGWSVCEWNGIPIYKDPYCVDQLFMVDSRAISILESMPMGWLNWGDDGIIKQDGSIDQWKAYWAWYASPVISNRPWCGKLVDIAVISDKY